MDIIMSFVDFILHMDVHLAQMVTDFGFWTYLILFVVIFIETGLVFTPFLPGDSLLFAAGAISALPEQTTLRPVLIFVLMATAAILGDTANYWIGHYIGPRAFSGNIRFLKKEYLIRTQNFYDKHGGITIFLARFIPIIRTFAPFVAGIGKMRYKYFITYNVIGGISWTAAFVFLGYFFGQVPFVKDHFSLLVIALVLIPGIPAIIEFFKARSHGKKQEAIQSQDESA
jgi:membrane-associated protein